MGEPHYYVEHYSAVPQALADENGSPHNGNKSNWSDKLETSNHTANPPTFPKSS